MGKASENLFWKALKQHINNEKNPKDINGRIKELAKKITLLGSRQALELLEDENNRNFYYKIYKAAVGYINNREMKLSKEYNMGKETCEKIISFYNYKFKSKFGLILLDVGFDKNLMEFSKSNGKPITFVGLNSCLGVVSKDYGIHLSPVSLTCEERYECYIDRITAMYHYVGQNANLITCSKCSNKEDTKSHVIDVKNVAVNRGDIFCDDNYRLLPSRDNERSRAMSWFCNKVIFNECNDRSEDKSIITITP